MINKYCCTCKINEKRINQKDCYSCHNASMKKWRKYNKLSGKAKKRDIVRSYAHVYLKKGKLIKKPCEICGNIIVQMHHEDYNYPLKVNWLCKIHHNKLRKYRLCELKGGVYETCCQ